jgi:hypothetical protein
MYQSAALCSGNRGNVEAPYDIFTLPVEWFRAGLRPRQARRQRRILLDCVLPDVLRIAEFSGETPFFDKDFATGRWSGAAIGMAHGIAQALNVQFAYVGATYATSVLDADQ